MERIFEAAEAADVAVKLVILILALTVHAFAQAISARWAGDPTATDEGRATLNPLKHIEPFGTLLVPAVVLVLTQGRLPIGSAKATPINQAALNDYQNLGVKMSGPAANLLFGLLAFGSLLLLAPIIEHKAMTYNLLYGLIFVNALLVLLNLLPLPGGDGAELVRFVLPQPLKNWWDLACRYGLGFVIMIALMAGLYFQYIDIQPFYELFDHLQYAVQDAFLWVRIRSL